MNHSRTIIRKAVVERLKSITKHVYDSRSKSLFDQHLPAILVYTRDERILEYIGDGDPNTRRELELCIEAVAKGENIDDDLDALALQIEQVLDDYTNPDRQADIFKLKSTESDIAIDGSKTYGAIRLTFTVTYQKGMP